MPTRRTAVLFVCFAALLGAWGLKISDKTLPARNASDRIDAAIAPATAAIVDKPRFARARVILKGEIDESRFADLKVEIVERRADGQLTLLVPADRLDDFRALPGTFTTRLSAPASAL